MDFTKDYYAVFDLKENVASAKIKEAYRKLAKRYHPDLHLGDDVCAHKMQEINEAWEVLGNEESRFTYDAYRKQALEAAAAAMAERQKSGMRQPPKGRTFRRKTYMPFEERYYLQGELVIKYHGVQDDAATANVLQEIYYRLKPTDVRANIKVNDIHKGKMPDKFRDLFSGKKVKLPPLGAIRCVIGSGDGQRHYRLEVHDLTVPDLFVQDVTKDDGDSFGTLKGTFYGYVLFTGYREEETEVTEMSGETGRREERAADGQHYRRKEYYYQDGSTYWGKWAQTRDTAGTNKYATHHQRAAADRGGCLGSAVALLFYGAWVLMLVILLPKLLLFWPFILGWVLLSLLSRRRRNYLAGGITGLALLGFLTVVFNLLSHRQVATKPAAEDNLERRLVKKAMAHGNDTLITHYRNWLDYEGESYTGRYVIRQSMLRRSGLGKAQLSAVVPELSDSTYDWVLSRLSVSDSNRLSGLYTMLDSIRRKKRPDSLRFAELLVSMVQDIPYAVVLPKECNADLYQDRFIRDYLKRPDAQCNANQPFGINTPVEFLAGLQGDCDTRTLLVYTVLRHYGYKVAVLSSDYYNHSLIGIDLPCEGTRFESPYGRFVVWEMTTRARPGLIPAEVDNLDKWRISLVSNL